MKYNWYNLCTPVYLYLCISNPGDSQPHRKRLGAFNEKLVPKSQSILKKKKKGYSYVEKIKNLTDSQMLPNLYKLMK